jgi:hypothetical protein
MVSIFSIPIRVNKSLTQNKLSLRLLCSCIAVNGSERRNEERSGVYKFEEKKKKKRQENGNIVKKHKLKPDILFLHSHLYM